MPVSKKQPTVLCLDIGNTSISYGLFRGKSFLSTGHVSENGIPVLINKFIKNVSIHPNLYILVSSVVPRVTHKIKLLSRKFKFDRKVFIVGERLKLLIEHKYHNINKLGKDRLVNIYGATRFYSCPVLILDFGTALTCDYVSAKAVFQGGLIIPGPEISFRALGERAALLPKIQFPGHAKGLIGRSTLSGMKLGILQGYGALTDGLVERFRKRYGRHFKVIATGGLVRTIAPYTRSINVIDPLLTLKSLTLVFREYLQGRPSSLS